MAHELFEQNRRRRNFWTSEGNLPGATDYQPSPSGYPSLVRAPGLGEPAESPAPAPAPNYPPPPQPPEMEPVSRGRRIGAAFAAFAARFGGEPGAGTRVGEQITGAPARQQTEDYQRKYGAWKTGLDYALANKRLAPAPGVDKLIDEGYNAEGKKVHVYQRPNGSTYERPSESMVRQEKEPAGRRAGLWEETFIKEQGRPPTLEEIQAHEQSVRAPIPAPATKGQLAAAENRKNTALRRLEASYRWTPESTDEAGKRIGGFFWNRTLGIQLSRDEFRKLKQQIQDDYEAELEALERTPKPFEYPSAAPSASPTQGGEDPLGILP
ncbi:hypothetical protein LCGC14_0903430 [marine sediment metagenome]|uniref:Uncharacterized protein n=1 Tax=marine sediment metagenome TaxID=412755 RepID=A0A0F9P0G4_9ZZZZ